MANNYLKVLSIAGFDGSAGAGIQADLKTLSALGCYGLTVLTTLAVQNSSGVKSIYELPLSCIREQLDAIFDDVSIDAVKIGMIYDSAIIEAVAAILTKYSIKKVVIDPVMYSKNSFALLKEEALLSLKKNLFPLATVVTPNIPEAETLLHAKILSEEDMEAVAQELMNFGSQAVVVKGGHRGEMFSKDVLYYLGKYHWFKATRFNTKNTRGTGCTFSSAIAAFLAKGFTIVEAVNHAKEFLTNVLEAGADFEFSKSGGSGPLYHFYKNCELTNFIH